MNDIYSEGITEEEAEIKYGDKLKYSDTGAYVRVLHYYLGVISFFDPDLPLLHINGVFDENTKDMVINFQNKYGLPATGEVDATTWEKMKEIYDKTIANIPEEYGKFEDEFFQGRVLALGMRGDDVRTLQRFLLTICRKFKNIPGVRVTGIFDELTESSILKLQEELHHHR